MMCTLPTIEQYNEAFQNIGAFIIDPTLKHGTVKKSQLGVPQALCGGFALTYKIETVSGKYAVRCFHKYSPDLHKRYEAISRRLKALRTPYFVDFEYQERGIRVGGKEYPIVKMAWEDGETLGEFIEKNHKDRRVLGRVVSAIREMAKFLRDNGIAHGDIQPGNVIVSGDGSRVALIDYDGMYVNEITSLGSSERGHRNFQHPDRGNSWNGSLDRFSFIEIVIALNLLREDPELWGKSGSDTEAIIFRENDYRDPLKSVVFKTLARVAQYRKEIEQFEDVCKGGFEDIPDVEEFFGGKVKKHRVVETRVTRVYGSQYPVLNANNYLITYESKPTNRCSMLYCK